MLALPLLMALAVTAVPAASPAVPPAPAKPEPAEAEGTGFIVAPPDAPGAVTPPAPAKPFLIEAFMAGRRTVVGATARVGGSRRGLEGALETTARWHGLAAGVTVGGAVKSGESVHTLGLVAGYGFSRGRYRCEALFGWGLASDRQDVAGITEVRRGHFRSVQLGLDRAVWGGPGWRATLGAGLWWRNLFGLASAPTTLEDLGGGLRLGIETGL